MRLYLKFELEEKDIMTHPQAACRLRWEALKARGNFTVEEITAIDNDTPWSEIEPRWWLEMMREKQQLLGLPR